MPNRSDNQTTIRGINRIFHPVPHADHGPALIVHGTHDSNLSISFSSYARMNIVQGQKNPDARGIPRLSRDSFRDKSSAGEDDRVPAKVW
jgi:hypothetical protein